MEKRKLRIGTLAKHLNIERFVIRFWEKEFNLRPSRSHGGQRYYDEKDLETFTHIKELLYKQGFTIAGAKKQLSERTIIPSQKTHMDIEVAVPINQKKQTVLNQQILALHEQLRKLRELL